jgi:hypothetical protein
MTAENGKLFCPLAKVFRGMEKRTIPLRSARFPERALYSLDEPFGEEVSERTPSAAAGADVYRTNHLPAFPRCLP